MRDNPGQSMSQSGTIGAMPLWHGMANWHMQHTACFVVSPTIQCGSRQFDSMSRVEGEVPMPWACPQVPMARALATIGHSPHAIGTSPTSHTMGTSTMVGNHRYHGGFPTSHAMGGWANCRSYNLRNCPCHGRFRKSQNETCAELPMPWGVQRIVKVTSRIQHFVKLTKGYLLHPAYKIF